MAEEKQTKQQDGAFAKLIAEYRPQTNYIALFESLYKNVNTRASRMSEFKKRVIASQPNLLDLSAVTRRGKDYPEYKTFMDKTQWDKYRAWVLARKPKFDKSGWEKALARANILPQNLVELKLPSALAAKRKESLENDQKRLDAANIEVNGNEMIQKLQLLESDNKWDVVLGLMLATGRRQNEVVVCEFEKLGVNEMGMSGKSKAGLSDDIPDVSFPTLAPAEFLITKINKIQSLLNLKDKTKTEINAAIAKPIGNRFRAKFDFKADVTAHSLRAIYANLAYAKFGEGSPQRYISKILGHDRRSNAQFYSRINIKNYSGQLYAPVQTAAETKQEIKTEIAAPPKLEWNPASKSEVNKKEAVDTLVKEGKRITQSLIKALKGGDVTAIRKFMEKNKAFIDAHNQSLMTSVSPTATK